MLFYNTLVTYCAASYVAHLLGFITVKALGTHSTPCFWKTLESACLTYYLAVIVQEKSSIDVSQAPGKITPSESGRCRLLGRGNASVPAHVECSCSLIYYQWA